MDKPYLNLFVRLLMASLGAQSPFSQLPINMTSELTEPHILLPKNLNYVPNVTIIKAYMDALNRWEMLQIVSNLIHDFELSSTQK